MCDVAEIRVGLARPFRRVRGWHVPESSKGVGSTIARLASFDHRKKQSTGENCVSYGLASPRSLLGWLASRFDSLEMQM